MISDRDLTIEDFGPKAAATALLVATAAGALHVEPSFASWGDEFARATSLGLCVGVGATLFAVFRGGPFERRCVAAQPGENRVPRPERGRVRATTDPGDREPVCSRQLRRLDQVLRPFGSRGSVHREELTGTPSSPFERRFRQHRFTLECTSSARTWENLAEIRDRHVRGRHAFKDELLACRYK